MHYFLCTQYIDSDLSQNIQQYDPTSADELISPSVIENYLKGNLSICLFDEKENTPNHLVFFDSWYLLINKRPGLFSQQ